MCWGQHHSQILASSILECHSPFCRLGIGHSHTRTLFLPWSMYVNDIWILFVSHAVIIWSGWRPESHCHNWWLLVCWLPRLIHNSSAWVLFFRLFLSIWDRRVGHWAEDVALFASDSLHPRYKTPQERDRMSESTKEMDLNKDLELSTYWYSYLDQGTIPCFSSWDI